MAELVKDNRWTVEEEELKFVDGLMIDLHGGGENNFKRRAFFCCCSCALFTQAKAHCLKRERPTCTHGQPAAVAKSQPSGARVKRRWLMALL